MNRDEEIDWSGGRKSKSRGAKPEGKSIPQAQLDRITRPSLAFYRVWVRHVNQFLADPNSWPSSSLKEDSEEWLPARIAEQRRAVEQAAETGDSREWSRQMDKLDRLLALRHAMMFALERRERQERARMAAGTRIGTTSAPRTRPSVPAYDPASDPFANE